jgi:hypothetical protein
MTLIDDSLPNQPQESDRQEPQSETAWRTIAAAIGWILLATACSFSIGFIVGFLKATLGWQDTVAYRLMLSTLSVCGFGAILLVASINRARKIGGGDARVGLGFAPIDKPLIIIVLAITLVAYGALRDYAVYKARPDLFYQFSSVSIWLALANGVVAVIVAPIAEELFLSRLALDRTPAALEPTSDRIANSRALVGAASRGRVLPGCVTYPRRAYSCASQASW